MSQNEKQRTSVPTREQYLKAYELLICIEKWEAINLNRATYQRSAEVVRHYQKEYPEEPLIPEELRKLW